MYLLYERSMPGMDVPQNRATSHKQTGISCDNDAKLRHKDKSSSLMNSALVPDSAQLRAVTELGSLKLFRFLETGPTP